jgi:hypothetical protein
MYIYSFVLFSFPGPLTYQLARERREHRVFTRLLDMVPGLEERLLEGSEEGVVHIAELVRCIRLFVLLPSSLFYFAQIQKGASSARSDDTKSLKSAILDWITPRGQSLNPPLARNVKIDRGFHHERTGALLCPAGLDWANTECAVLSNISTKLTHFSRTKEKLRSGELAVPGDQWPIFLYYGYIYDPEDPWNGLFRSSLLVSVSCMSF